MTLDRQLGRANTTGVKTAIGHFRFRDHGLLAGRPSQGGFVRYERNAFTMAELVVSMGILGLMLVLVGKVFSIAVDSTNQARSLMEVSHSFRLLEETLRADLRGVDPSRSMLVISGNTINAYWTPDGPEVDDDGDPNTGYLHSGDADREVVGMGINGDPNPPWKLESPRADVLMLFTSRPATSVQYPDIKSNSTLVVWGHAEQGKLNSDGIWQVQPLKFPAQVPPPGPPTVFWNPAEVLRDRYIARNWHLARRSTLLVDSPETELEDILGTIAGLAVPVEIDPGPGMLPEEPQMVLAADKFNLQEGLIDIVNTDGTGFQFDELIVEGLASADVSEAGLQTWYARSRLDPSPPAKMAGRLGHYFLPNCASVKVEWTCSHPLFDAAIDEWGEVVWVDPADTDRSVIQQLSRLYGIGLPADLVDFFTTGAGATDRFDPKRMPGGVVPLEPRTHVFYSRDPDPAASPSDPDPFFPTALRITVDVFDDGGRFQRPTRQVMVLPVGEGS